MRDIPRLKAEFFRSVGRPVRIVVVGILCDRQRTVSDLLAPARQMRCGMAATTRDELRQS